MVVSASQINYRNRRTKQADIGNDNRKYDGEEDDDDDDDGNNNNDNDHGNDNENDQ